MAIGLFGGLRILDSEVITEITQDFGLQRVLSDVLQDGSRESGWWVALAVGIFGTAYTGMGAVRALRIVHAAAWGVRPGRQWRPMAASVAMLAVVVGLMVAAAMVAWVRERTPAGGLFSALAMTGLYYVVWLGIAAHLPRPAGVPVRALRPGALLVALGLQGVHLLTVYVLSAHAERVTSVYGSIGAALALLLWLYVVARLLVAASVLSAELAAPAGDADALEGEAPSRRGI